MTLVTGEEGYRQLQKSFRIVYNALNTFKSGLVEDSSHVRNFILQKLFSNRSKWSTLKKSYLKCTRPL